MSLTRIDESLCDGCGICVETCPVDVIRMGEAEKPWVQKGWKAKIAYPSECNSCCLCKEDCPQMAIAVSYQVEIPSDCLPYPLSPKRSAG